VIVGLTGRARSGKSTAANIISKAYGITEIAFADPLKEAAIHMFGITRDMAYGVNYNREEVVQPWGISVRTMLQKLGTECARMVFQDDFWTVRADIEVESNPMYFDGFILTDVRFDNEAKWVADRGGVVIHLHRTVGGIGNEHASEKGVSGSLIDHHVPNEGTVADLEILLRGVLDGRNN